MQLGPEGTPAPRTQGLQAAGTPPRDQHPAPFPLSLPACWSTGVHGSPTPAALPPPPLAQAPGLTRSRVEPVLIVGGKLFVLGQLHRVYPFGNFELPGPGPRGQQGKRSQKPGRAAPPHTPQPRPCRSPPHSLLEEGCQSSDELLLVDVFDGNTGHLRGKVRRDDHLAAARSRPPQPGGEAPHVVRPPAVRPAPPKPPELRTTPPGHVRARRSHVAAAPGGGAARADDPGTRRRALPPAGTRPRRPRAHPGPERPLTVRPPRCQPGERERRGFPGAQVGRRISREAPELARAGLRHTAPPP